ncbi:hypothetical protein CN983_28575, partial [Bacillus cereus]
LVGNLNEPVADLTKEIGVLGHIEIILCVVGAVISDPVRPLGTDGEGVVQVRACAPDLTTGLVSGVSVDIAELADPGLADPTVAHDGRVP